MSKRFLRGAVHGATEGGGLAMFSPATEKLRPNEKPGQSKTGLNLDFDWPESSIRLAWTEPFFWEVGKNQSRLA